MQCREVVKLLPDYSVKRLKSRQEAAIASHLDGCPACRREGQALQAAIGLVEAFGAVEPPAGLWNGIYNRITGEVPEPAAPALWRRLWTRPAQAIGSAAIVITVAAGLWISSSPAPVTLSPPDRALVAAVQEHALASADGLFADRAGLESLAALTDEAAPAGPRSSSNH